MFYVYLHIRANDGIPFYIGKGKDKRYNSKCSRSLYWHNVVNKYGYDIIILEDNLSNSKAIEKEKYWIDRIGREDNKSGSLVNFTDGGEGTTGKVVNIKTRKAVAESNRNRIVSRKNKETTGNLFRGKLGKEHNRSIQIICDGIVYNGYSEASREMNIGITTVYYRVNSKSKNWMHFQIKN